MLKTFELRERDKPLTVHGPPGTEGLLEAHAPGLRPPVATGFEIVELEPGQAIERDGYEVAPYPVRHRGPALGYALVEDPRPGRFDVETARALGVRPGPAFGRLQRGETVDGVTPDQVVGPDAAAGARSSSPATRALRTLRGGRPRRRRPRPRGDVRPRGRRPRGADRPQHRPAGGAGRGGRRGRHARAYPHLHAATPEATCATRRAPCSAHVVPRDFDTIEVPLAEKGEPELIRWDAERRPPAVRRRAAVVA